MREARSPKVALDKLAFLMAFVPYLTHRGRVSVAEAAAHFGYDEEFIRRSARALTVSGIADGPVPDGDLFDIDFDALDHHDEIALVYRIAIDDEVPRLSGREAAALLAGLQVLAGDPTIAALPEYAALLDKLRRGASSEPEPTAVEPTSSSYFAPLRQAITDRRRVAFDYRAAGSAEVQRREVEPLRLESIDGIGHLRGWCLLRQGVRTFRLDRISEFETLTTDVEHDVTALDEAPDAFASGESELIVTVSFDAAGEPLAMAYRPTSLEIDRQSGEARMDVAIAARSTLLRLLGELPGARVEAPDDVRGAVLDWAREALGRYGDGAQ